MSLGYYYIVCFTQMKTSLQLVLVISNSPKHWETHVFARRRISDGLGVLHTQQKIIKLDARRNFVLIAKAGLQNMP